MTGKPHLLPLREPRGTSPSKKLAQRGPRRANVARLREQAQLAQPPRARLDLSGGRDQLGNITD
eukprot:557292-Pyramimonas_sp.AAC.1